jgi:hypothetical protein
MTEGQLSDHKAPILVEVQGGGGLESPPHHPFIRIYADGLVETWRDKHRLSPSELKTFQAKLKRLGAEKLTQATLDHAKLQPGEPVPGRRGGSGVITLSLYGHPAISLNQPSAYNQSKQPALRAFLEILRLSEQAAKVKIDFGNR